MGNAQSFPKIDVILYDEAGFGNDAETMMAVMPFLKDEQPAPLVVLSGDCHQLTNCPRSKAARESGYGKSTLARLANLQCYHKDSCATARLTVTHRNAKRIVSAMKALVYGEEVKALEEKEDGQIIFVHTNGTTRKQTGDKSLSNIAEGMAALQKAREYQIQDPSKKVLIVVAYLSQQSVINELQKQDKQQQIAVYTAEGIQGDEADTVVFSPSYSTPFPITPNSPAWSDQENLLCMVASRAKTRLIICTDTFQSLIQPNLRKLWDLRTPTKGPYVNNCSIKEYPGIQGKTNFPSFFLLNNLKGTIRYIATNLQKIANFFSITLYSIFPKDSRITRLLTTNDSSLYKKRDLLDNKQNLPPQFKHEHVN